MPAKIEIRHTEDKSQPIVVLSRENFTGTFLLQLQLTSSGDLTFFWLHLLDAVVWNPSPEKLKSFSDLSGWEDFVCVEAGVIETPISLEPGQSWHGAQSIHTMHASSL